MGLIWINDVFPKNAENRLIKIINIPLGGKPHVAAVQKDSTLHCKIWSARSALSLPRFCMMNTNHLLNQLCFLVFCGEGFKPLHPLLYHGQIHINFNISECKWFRTWTEYTWNILTVSLYLTKLLILDFPALVLNKLDPGPKPFSAWKRSRCRDAHRANSLGCATLCCEIFHGGHASGVLEYSKEKFQDLHTLHIFAYSTHNATMQRHVELLSLKTTNILGKNSKGHLPNEHTKDRWSKQSILEAWGMYKIFEPRDEIWLRKVLNRFIISIHGRNKNWDVWTDSTMWMYRHVDCKPIARLQLVELISPKIWQEYICNDGRYPRIP